MTIANVIDWKFNSQPGMRCKEIDGVMTIVEFPGGIPSQAEQDLWTAEYNTWIASGGPKDIEADPANVCPFLKAYILGINDGSIVPGSNMTNAQLKAAIRAKL